MANGNVYAPLYSSIEARGRLSPLGAPGALKPYEEKKALGDKMASALGAMIDQSMEGDDKKRISQLTLRNEDLIKEENEWIGTTDWNQENYEWEAFGIEHSGHKRNQEYLKNIEEIKQIEINQHMGIFDEPQENNGFFSQLLGMGQNFIKG